MKSAEQMDKISDKIYKCDYGYFMLEDKFWLFVPDEKPMNIYDVQVILNQLYKLNEKLYSETKQSS